jgi:mRNA-degrading endonuclease RelE of RelBE toxin-antitoxin system
MVFLETPTFFAESRKVFSDDDIIDLQIFLAENPEAGDMIPHSGGCRKIRWSTGGRGKRGGARVVYFYYASKENILLLRAYAKNKKADLSSAELKKLREIIKGN